MKLRISPDLNLPLEAVTQTFGILAKRGVGKTYTGAVLVEEMLKAGAVPVIADPIGVWWGLRAAANGKDPGLPITVLGGDYGDAPLEETAGKLVADLIVDDRLPLVLDLSRFRKGQQTRFMTDFAEQLYHRNRQPLHLVLDEADAFAPQRPMKGQERLLGAIEDLVRRGRARGLGVTLITQRAAVLNKDVLTQVEVLVALRTIAPQDRDAVDAWIRVHGTPAQREELMRSLASLPVGTAWFWSPGWLDLFQRVQVRRRETFDSSATPDAGAGARTGPKQLAPVDLEKLKTRMAETIERARKDDPRELRKEIEGLKAQLQKAQISPEEEQRIRDEVHQLYQPYLGSLDAALRTILYLPKRYAHAADAANEAIEIARVATRAATPPPAPRQPAADLVRVVSGSAAPMPGGERRILTALAQYPQGRTKKQIAILTGYAVSGGGFNNYVGSLRSKGWVEGYDSIRITEAGLKSLGAYDALPHGEALLDHWRRQLGKAERAILDALAAAYPKQLSKEDVAARAGYEPSGGGFNNALGRLRTLELVQGRGWLRASDDLFS